MKVNKILRQCSAVALSATMLLGTGFTSVTSLPVSTGISVSAASTLSISKTQMSLGKGETARLTVNVSGVKWRTSNAKVVTVDQNGNVKAVGTGTAQVTAKTNAGAEMSCKITVKNAPTKITLTKGVVTIGVGEKFTVGSGVNDGAACAKRTYRTSNSSIVKMTRTDWQGDFVGVKPGVAYVTVRTYNGKESTCKVTVKAAPQNVKLSRGLIKMTVGQKASLSAIIPDNAGCATRTFRTSNSKVVKMTKTNWTGEFTAVSEGTAYVTVRTYNGKEASCKIVVLPKLTDMYTSQMTANFKKQLKAEAAKNGGVIKMTVWCSEDDSSLEKTLVESFKKLYSDSSYQWKISFRNVSDAYAGGKIMDNPENGADVFNFAADQLSALVEAGAIAPVSDTFKNNVLADSTTDALTECNINHQLYAFPKSCDEGYFLYYDKRVFNASDVATMEGMIKKANAAGKSVYYNLGNAWYSAGIFLAAGVNLQYENGVQTANFDSREGLAAAKAMCRLASYSGKGLIGSTGGEGDNQTVINGFKNGKIAAAVIGTWVDKDLKNAIGANNLGAAKLPTVIINGTQTQLHSFGGYTAVGVNSATKYPVASQLLAYYLTDHNAQLKWHNTKGMAPTSKTVLIENPSIQNDPVMSAILAQRPYAHSQNHTVGDSYFISDVAALGSDIVTTKGQRTDAELKQYLKNIQSQIH